MTFFPQYIWAYERLFEYNEWNRGEEMNVMQGLDLLKCFKMDWDGLTKSKVEYGIEKV